MTNREIGLGLTRLREARDLTLADLAATADLSPGQVSRLENGRQGLRSSTLVRIARALGVPPFRLLMTDDEWEPYGAGQALRDGARRDLAEFERPETEG